MVFQDEHLAKEHNAELRLVTNNIEEVYAKVSASHPRLLHPNLNKVTLRPKVQKNLQLRICNLVLDSSNGNN